MKLLFYSKIKDCSFKEEKTALMDLSFLKQASILVIGNGLMMMTDGLINEQINAMDKWRDGWMR